MLWRPAESPVLFFIFFYQWVQTSISLFAANLRDIPVAEFSGYRGDIEQAIVLSLSGIVALALGARIGMGARLARHAEQARIVASSRPLSEWFLLYLKALAIASFAQAFAWIVPGLSQPLLALASMKWAFFWMLAFASFLDPRSPKLYFIIAFGLEFALGFGGYFSDFKTVIFFSIFAAIASGVRFSPRSIVALGAATILLLVLGVIWTAVKRDYRDFIAGHQKSQVVVTDYYTNVSELWYLVDQLDERKIAIAEKKILLRLSYVEFFSLILNRVPHLLPHEHGALWLDAVSRPLMPRLLFPDKTSIDDFNSHKKIYGS